MGQAFDRDGNVLGEAEGDTRSEVLQKLEKAHADAAMIQIRERIKALETQIGVCGDTPILAKDLKEAMAEPVDAVRAGGVSDSQKEEK